MANWYRLNSNERGMTGFTDVLVFDYTELTAAATTQTISPRCRNVCSTPA